MGDGPGDNTDQNMEHEYVDVETGESIAEQSLIPVIEPPTALDIFRGISEIEITDEERTVLEEQANPEDVEIRPDGLIFYSHMRIRERFSKAFGPGRWALMPVSGVRIKDNLAIRDWVMFIKGKFFSYAIGEASYNPKNRMMTWGDVLETLKSNALSRLAKDIPIAPELWSKRYAYQFQQQYCVRVTYLDYRNTVVKGWRRLDSPPFDGEINVLDDSPNKDKYTAPSHSPIPVKKAVEKSTVETKPAPKESASSAVTSQVVKPVAQPPATDASSQSPSTLDEAKSGDFIHKVMIWTGEQKAENAMPVIPKVVDTFIKTYVGKGNVFDHEAHLNNFLRKHFHVDRLGELSWGRWLALRAYAEKEAGETSGGPAAYTVDKDRMLAKYLPDEQGDVNADAPVVVDMATTEAIPYDVTLPELKEAWARIFYADGVGTPVNLEEVTRQRWGIINGEKLDAEKRDQLMRLVDAVETQRLTRTLEAVVEALRL